jgi:hypothetical protein
MLYGRVGICWTQMRENLKLSTPQAIASGEYSTIIVKLQNSMSLTQRKKSIVTSAIG